MRSRLLLACFLIVFCLSACEKLPDAVDSYGHPIDMADYRGKWVFVNYWASWCQPCLTELPELEALYKQHADKLVVLGVSFDSLSPTEMQKFADALHITFPLLSKFPAEKFEVSRIDSLPMTLIINPQGKLLKMLYGPQNKESLLSYAEEAETNE